MKKPVKDVSLAGLESIRQQIAGIRQQIVEINGQTLTDAEIADAVNRTVDGWASRVDAGWIGINIANGRTADPAMLVTACAGEADKITCLLAWLHGDAIKAKLLDAAMPFASDGETTEQRAERVREMEGEVHQLEIEEEHMVCQLEARGIEVFRRPDADPAIVLGIDEAA